MPFVAPCFRYTLRKNDTPYRFCSLTRYSRFDTSPYEIAGMRERKDAKSNRPSGNIVATRAHHRRASLLLISVTRFAKTIRRIVFARLPVIPASIPLRTSALLCERRYYNTRFFVLQVFFSKTERKNETGARIALFFLQQVDFSVGLW